MHRSDSFPAPFRLNQWLVQPALNRITGPDGATGIEPRVMKVLLVLADRPGEVVPRGDLLDEVWGDAVVGEEILTRAVSELRRVFGDSARSPAYIETIRQHGYRLIAPVIPVGPEETPGPAAPPGPPPGGPAGSGPAAPGPSAVPPASGRIKGAPRSVVLVLACLVLVGLVFAPRVVRELTRRPEEPQPAPTGPLAVPLTSFPGRELHPALSPDGTRVAFVWTGPEGSHADLWVKQRNSETPLRLTDDPAWVAWPAWSPDGQTLAYVQGADTGSVIRLIPSLGGPVREIHREGGWIEGLDWSPDGALLAFSARGSGRPFHEIWFLSLEDFLVDRFAVGDYEHAGMIQPRFSPDGSEIAWIGIGPDRSSSLYAAPVSGASPRRLVGGPAPMQGLAWTSDARYLVFGWSPDDRFTLWRVPREGGDPRWIPTPGDFAWNPTTSRETRDLAYEEVRMTQDLWRVRILGRDPWQLGTGPFLASTRREGDADFHPAGNQVVFVSSRSGYAELWLSGADGTNPRQVTNLKAASVNNPRWGPGGDRIAFNAVTEGMSRVMVVQSLGGRSREIDTGNGPALFTDWTADGRALLVGADRGEGWEIHRLPLSGGGLVPLTTQGGLTATEDRTGRTLYFTRPAAAGLWRQPLRDGLPAGEAEVVVADLDPRDGRHWRLVRGPAGVTGIVYVARMGGEAFLSLFDVRDGTSSFLTDLPDLAPSGLAVSPAGDAILYSRTQLEAGDLMLIRPLAP